jgi:hypothetical protein
MSFNPFSFENSLEHLVNPKIVTGATGYEVQVDLANVDIYYGRQLGGPTAVREFEQAYIQQIGITGLPTQQAFITQIGTTGSPTQQAFITQIGTTGSSGSAFFNQIGSSNSRGDGYFNTIYWNAFSPAISGGGGSGATLLNGPGIDITTSASGDTISSLIQVGSGLTLNNPGNGQPFIIGNTINPTFVQGSTGIRVVQSGNTYTLSSTVAVSGSQYIGVQQSGATFTISYLGSQGGGSGTIAGVSGAYAVFGSTGIESSTVLNSLNVVGPTGQLVFYTPQGITSSSLFTVDVVGTQINLPITVINTAISPTQPGANLRLANNATDTFIQSGSSDVQGSAAPLNISAIASGTTITKFDLPTGLVTINPGNSYPSGIRNLGASTISQNLFYGSSGATYNIYMWGGGGHGLSGYAGGAGGFVKVENVVAGASGITFGFSIGGTGGGNSLGLTVNTGSGDAAAAVAPGGGAGGSIGVGAAFGEPGGSYPGQGFSAGVTGGSGGIYTDYETNGTTGFVYKLGVTGITAQSGIFNNVQVSYGLTGIFPTGTILYGFNSNPSLLDNGLSGATATYFFPPGTTLVFETSGITFNNSTYSLSGITFGIFDLAVPLNSLTGATFSRQASGGTFTIDTTLANQQFQDGFIGGTFSGDGSGIHEMLGGHTFSLGVTGLTLTFFNADVQDNSITGGIQVTFNSESTGTFSRSLGSVVAPQLRITDPIGISQNSIIQVQYQNIITHGVDGVLGASGIFGPTGSGYGFYTGGGGTAGGGGGAGSAKILAGFTGITGAGSGISPFFDTYNSAGQYGFGGSGTTGGLPYYVVELVSPGTQPDVLLVNGNETINGSLVVNQPANGINNWAALQFSNGNQSALSTSYSFIKGSDVGGGGINANTLYLYRYGGSTYSFVSQQFAGSPVLTISAISAGTGVTGSAPNSFDLNANTIIRGNVSLPGGYYADSTQFYGASGTAPSTLDVTGTIKGITGIFSGLVTCQAGITASGATFSGYVVGLTGASFGSTVLATDFTIPSDRRLKENIQTVDSALDKISKLRGVYFTKIGSERRNLGVIAQEIEEIIPEVVFTDDTPEQMKSVAYGNIIGLLIEAVKELKEQVIIQQTK